MNRRLAVAALAVLAATTGCTKKKSTDEPPDPARAGSGSAAAAVRIGGDFAVAPGDAPNADRMIAAVRAATTAPRAIAYMHFHYVHANGTLDAKYGEAMVVTGDATALLPQPGAADDPGRPIGAPVVDAPPRAPVDGCLDYKLAPGGVLTTSPMMGGCVPLVPSESREACTIARLWQLAIADGAPANALASFDLGSSSGTADWWVSIDDEPRNYHFNKRYEAAACRSVPDGATLPAEALPIDGPAAAESASSTADPCSEAQCRMAKQLPPCCAKYAGKLAPPELAPPDPAATTTEPDRQALVAAIKKTVPVLKQCATEGTKGVAKLKVAVDAKGKGTVTELTGTLEDPKARACIVAAFRTIALPATGNPYTFAYPVTFQ